MGRHMMDLEKVLGSLPLILYNLQITILDLSLKSTGSRYNLINAKLIK